MYMNVCVHVCENVCTAMPAVRRILRLSLNSPFLSSLFSHNTPRTKTCRFLEELSFAADDMSFAIHQMKRCVATRLVMMKRYEPCHGKRFSSVEDFLFLFLFVKLSELICDDIANF